MIWKVLLWVLGIFIVFQVVARIICKLYPHPMPYWSAFILERPTRRITEPLAKKLDQFGVKPGMRVLEVGSGGGYFTIEAARRVGNEGRLFAVDIQPEMIARLWSSLTGGKIAQIFINQ